MTRKTFLNLPVSNLDRSVGFFTKLGFSFNKQFTDNTAACMVISEDAYVMLLTRDKFGQFAKRPIGDASTQTAAMIAVSCESRAEVDQLTATALASGGSVAGETQDYGFMYGKSFYDPDGFHWEVLWMDPGHIQK